MRHVAAGLLLSLLSISLARGQPVAEATLSGRITDAATRQPIEGAQISWRGGGRGGNPTVALSDAEGKYSIRLPAPQRAGLAISKAGYSTLDIASSDTVDVRLKAGDSATRDFELSKPGIISGRLLDRDSGKPIPDFYIHAIRWFAGLENSTGFRYPAAPTSADGSFSIANLPPATYVLVVDPPMGGKIGAPSEADEKTKSDAGYGPAWYPGVPRPDMAAPITLGYGENRQLEVRLRKHPLLHISGLFSLPEGMEGGSVSITLTTDAKGRPTGAEGEIPRAGPFRIDGLEDGSYGVLAATRSKDGRTTFASTPVTLAGHSVEGLRIEMRPGVALRVEVKMAEENAAPPSRIGFVPLSTEGWGPMMDIGPPGGDDVPYRTGLPPGRYDVALMQLRGYAVASIVLNGTPVPPGAEVDLESSESVLTYTLTTHLGAVTGTVRDSDGQTVADAAVVLAPESFAATGQDRLSLPPGNGDETTSDDGGRFSFSGLAPGRYKAIAMKGDGRFRAFDVGTMRDRMRTADVVVVSADQSVRIDVEVGK